MAPTETLNADLRLLLEEDPVAAALQVPSLAPEVRATLDGKGRRQELPRPMDMLLADVRRLVGRHISLTALLQSTAETQQQGPECPREVVPRIQGMLADNRRELMAVIKRFGAPLETGSRQRREFLHVPTLGNAHDERELVDTTYANFALLRQRDRELRASSSETADALRTFAAAQRLDNLPGMGQIMTDLTFQHPETESRQTRLNRQMRVCWNDAGVRIAWERMQHMKWIRDLDQGHRVLESGWSIHLLNRMYEEWKKNRGRKSAGIALIGPAGFGKTELLMYFYRELLGIEPLVAAVDRSMGSFTLIARPVLGDEEQPAEPLIAYIRDMTHPQLVQFVQTHRELCASIGVTPDQILRANYTRRIATAKEAIVGALHSHRQKELATALTTLQAGQGLQGSRGYHHHIVLQALYRNGRGCALLVDEFFALSDFNAFHYLLENAIPATDEEAGPTPPTEWTGKPVRGWWFEPITTRWYRVGPDFSFNITGNVGTERNQLLTNPVASRFGTALITVPTPEYDTERMFDDLARSVVCPRLCDKETGQFQLDDAVAYRLHFLITKVIPHILADLDRRSRVGGQMNIPPISIRTLEDLALLIRPTERGRSPVDLYEAVWRTLIQPFATTQYMQSLEVIVAWLLMAGFLPSKDSSTDVRGGERRAANFEERLQRIFPEGNLRRVQQMKDQLSTTGGTQAQTTSGADVEDVQFREAVYTTSDKIYEGKCAVCNVGHCPFHGGVSKEYAERLEQIDDIGRIGVTPEILDHLAREQQVSLGEQNWDRFLAIYLNTDAAHALRSVPPALNGHLAGLVAECGEHPERAAEIVPLLQGCIDRGLLASGACNAAWQTAVTTHWTQRLAAACTELRNLGTIVNAGTTRETERLMTNEILPGTQVIACLQAMDGEHRLEPDLSEDLANVVLPRGNAAVLAGLHRLRTNNDRLRGQVIAAVPAQRGTLARELAVARDALAGSQRDNGPRQRAEGPLPDGLSPLERIYGPLSRALAVARDLVTLGAVEGDELDELTGFARGLIRDGFAENAPQAVLPYVRTLAAVADLQNTRLSEALAYFTRPVQVPLPPARKF